MFRIDYRLSYITFPTLLVLLLVTIYIDLFVEHDQPESLQFRSSYYVAWSASSHASSSISVSVSE